MKESELFEWMTPEQRAEWTNARENKLCTDMRFGAAECGSDGIWIPVETEYRGERSFYNTWETTGFDVIDGEPMAITWTCDGDGDWSESCETPLKDYDPEFHFEDSMRRSRLAQAEYYSYVAESGDDCLGEFYIPSTYKKRTAWQFIGTNSICGPRFMVRPKGRGQYQSPSVYGEDVERFFQCENLAELHDIESDDPARKEVQITRITGDKAKPYQVRGDAWFTREFPRKSYVRDLKRRARKAYKEASNA